MSEMDMYLRETPVFVTGSPRLAAFMEEAIQGAATPGEKAAALFYAVREKVIYDPYSPFYEPRHYTPDAILTRGSGYCVQKAALLVAACRAAGVPARLGFANLRNHGATQEIKDAMGTDIFAWHGFAEIFLDGKWVKATPAFHADLCKRHNIAPVEFNGVDDAVFPSTDLAGKPYAEYVCYHGSFDDLPFDRVMKGWREVYGNERVDLWLAAFKSGEVDSWREGRRS